MFTVFFYVYIIFYNWSVFSVSGVDPNPAMLWTDSVRSDRIVFDQVFVVREVYLDVVCGTMQ